MSGLVDDPGWKRKQKEVELAGRKFRQSQLQLKRDALVQTGQDATAVGEELAGIEAEIARLEEGLRQS